MSHSQALLIPGKCIVQVLVPCAKLVVPSDPEAEVF
jgi:hypothetical protein